jgi:hypothetical protein
MAALAKWPILHANLAEWEIDRVVRYADCMKIASAC